MRREKNDALPKISIIIPSYNKVKYIDQTLKSIFEQKYKNLEVIINDGGSTDGTVSIIKEYVKRYNIIFKSKKDNGQLDAVNKGLEKATGDIVTFINADDCYERNALFLISKAYQTHPDSLWFSGRGAVVNKKNIEIAKPVTWYKNFLLSRINYYSLLANNFLIQPSVFVSKAALKKYGPFTGTKDFIMEYDLWLKLCRISVPTVINKNISKFRIDDNTKTKTMYMQLLKEDWKIVKKYTHNPLVLALHLLNNFGRELVGIFV